MFVGSIKTGDRIEISDSNATGVKKVYVSVVEEVLDLSRLLAHMPIEYGKLVKLDKNTRYSVLFFTEKGMLQFDSMVIDYEKTDGFNLMKIKLISEGERMQRRSFFRFNCVIPFTFQIADTDNKDTYEGIIKDICGGGLRFVTNIEVADMKTVNCIIDLNENKIMVSGRILHKQHFPKSLYAYQYRIQFTGIMYNDQEKIVQYVYNEQRKIVRRTR